MRTFIFVAAVAALGTSLLFADVSVVNPPDLSQYATSSAVTNVTRDAFSTALVVEDVSGTATVSRTSSGVYYKEFITLADTTTVLRVDTSTFPTNGGTSLAWSLNPNGQTITVDSDSIDTSSWASVTLTTNAFNDLIFRKAPYSTKFKVQGE